VLIEQITCGQIDGDLEIVSVVLPDATLLYRSSEHVAYQMHDATRLLGCWNEIIRW
jgi:hypothetical protein